MAFKAIWLDSVTFEGRVWESNLKLIKNEEKIAKDKVHRTGSEVFIDTLSFMTIFSHVNN